MSDAVVEEPSAAADGVAPAPQAVPRVHGASLARRVALLVLGVALPLLLVLAALTWASVQQRDASRRATHSADVIAQATNVQKLVLDVETGQRGYIITGDPTFLQPRNEARPRLAGATADLARLVRDQHDQHDLAVDVQRRVDRYLHDYSDPIVVAARTDRSAATNRVVSGVGKRQVDGIRADVTRLVDREQQLSHDRTRRADHIARIAAWSGVGAAILAALLLSVMALYLRRTVVQPILVLTAAAGAIEAGQLDARVPVEHDDELGRLAQGFNEMAAGLARARAELELQRAEVEQQAERLARSNADLEQFAYAAAHDLQEPLRSVASYTSLLQRRYAGQLDDDADDFIGFAVEGATRMQQLINDLLQYSRLSTRDQDRELVALSDVATSARTNLTMAIREADAEVVVPDDMPEVQASASQLTLLLQNLMGNAIKFRGERPPRIEVSASRLPSGRIELRVADNGIGIQPEHRERIFRLFQRLNSRAHYQGTGIGLALCKRIVERHGGTIRADDREGDETGTVFVLDLPAALPSTTAAQADTHTTSEVTT